MIPSKSNMELDSCHTRQSRCNQDITPIKVCASDGGDRRQVIRELSDEAVYVVEVVPKGGHFGHR